MTLGRAYVATKTEAQARAVIDAMNGHVFVDEEGTSHQIIVDFAPYQKIPRLRPRRDVREGTIEQDPSYKAFVEQLNKPIEVRHTCVANDHKLSGECRYSQLLFCVSPQQRLAHHAASA